jgi:hypothetical protein
MIATSKIKKITLPGDTPPCDLCVVEPHGLEHPRDAEFDMPTIYGSWGYVCRDHLESHVAPGAYETGTCITWTG